MVWIRAGLSRRTRMRTAAAVAALSAGWAVAATAAGQTTTDDTMVEELVVTGRAQRLYRIEEISSGKLPAAPLATPISVQVINADLIRDQGARDAQDLYRNISGVTVFSYAGVTARGFRQEENFFDGLRGDPYAGFSVPQLFNIERVEFLKGPAGMLYGPGSPGGVFNYLTKVPTDQLSAQVSGVVGVEGRYGGSAEIIGPLASNGLAGRIGLFYENQDGPRRNAGEESIIFDAGVTVPLGERADLILQATRYEQNLAANRLRGVPTDDLGHFIADRRWNHNEPGDYLNLESEVVQARLEAEPNEAFSFDIGARWNLGLEVQQYHEPRGLFDSDGDGAVDASIREFRDQSREQESLSFGANAIWSTSFGPVSNRLLAGYDYFFQDYDFYSRLVRGRTTAVAGLPPPLSLTEPQYGLADPTTYDLPAFGYSQTEQTRQGGYLLEELTLGRFIATVGLRYDSFEDIDLASGEQFEDQATTWRAGLVYRIRPDLSAYAQWAQSYEPQSVSQQLPEVGGPFEPTTGEMLEGGVKTELFGGRLQGSLVAYHIVRENLLQSDPRGDVGGDGEDDLVAFGEVTSKGVEFDLAADLTPNWVLTLAYAYNDTRITKDNGLTAITNAVADRFANAPEHQAGFWTRYQLPVRNLAIALGGDYVDVRQSLSGQKVRPYLIFDASLIYETGPWRALLRVDNLTDETYAASGFVDRTGHFPGAPRSVFLEVTRRW